MKMTNTKKIIIGLLTFAPILFLFWFLSNVADFFTELSVSKDTTPEDIVPSIKSIVAPFLYILLLTLAMMIFYLIDIFKFNPKFKKEHNDKGIWAVVVIFTGWIGMIIYFFLEIYPRKENPDPVSEDGFERWS